MNWRINKIIENRNINQNSSTYSNYFKINKSTNKNKKKIYINNYNMGNKKIHFKIFNNNNKKYQKNK